MIRALCVAAGLLAAFSAQAEREYEYKCWVTLADGTELISFQKLDTKSQHSLAKRSLMKKGEVQTRHGGKSLKQVHECVELQRDFIDLKARALDNVTTR